MRKRWQFAETEQSLLYRFQTERCWSRSIDPAGANRAQSSHHRFSDKHFPTHKGGRSDRKQIKTKHDSREGKISHDCTSSCTYDSVNWQKKSCTEVFVHSYILLLLQDKLFPFSIKDKLCPFCCQLQHFHLVSIFASWSNVKMLAITHLPQSPPSSQTPPGSPPSCWIHLSSTVPLNMYGGHHLLCFYVDILIHV